jgi:hypothetical protein
MLSLDFIISLWIENRKTRSVIRNFTPTLGAFRIKTVPIIDCFSSFPTVNVLLNIQMKSLCLGEILADTTGSHFTVRVCRFEVPSLLLKLQCKFNPEAHTVVHKAEIASKLLAAIDIGGARWGKRAFKYQFLYFLPPPAVTKTRAR